MNRLRSIFTALVISSVISQANAQSSNAFPSLIYPLSVNSQALGEQGVTLLEPADAMQYNPAALVYSPDVSASFFVNPWKIISVSFGQAFPTASYLVATKMAGLGNLGIQYTDKDAGTFITTTAQNPDSGTAYHNYERTFAVGFARSMSDELSLGLQLRYAVDNFGPTWKAANIFVSAGLLYKPSFFERRLDVGFALTNFGSAVKPDNSEFSEAAPSMVNLGIRGLPVRNRYFDIDLLLGTTKILHKQAGPNSPYAESSFEALVNDWGNFPDDMTAQAGLEFAWHSIYLGAGIFFIQKMYLGYFTTGPKELYNSFYTHGADIGFEAHGITATAGYAGRWHNNNAGSYLQWSFPWETFQFTLAGNMEQLESSEWRGTSVSPFKKIVLSGEVSYGTFLGRLKGGSSESSLGTIGVLPLPSYSNTWSPRVTFSIAADLYFSNRMALTTSFGYTRLKGQLTFEGGFVGYQAIDLSTETFFLTSGLRYHPLVVFDPLFVEGDIGIDRLNPIMQSQPRYVYASLTDVSVGGAFPILSSNLVITPKVGLRTLYAGVGSLGSRLGGYNQVLYTLSIGYSR